MQLLRALRRPFRRRPIDWTTGAGREAAPRPNGVDVIIPVYGAAAELAACRESVLAHTDLAKNRVILVVDGPQNDAVDEIVAGFGAAGATILRNAQRCGFVKTAKGGMQESTRDVVLLNSDTVVTSGWIGKLVDAAYSSGDIGTVTPLSNHATLVSVPRGFNENLLPRGHDVASFGALVERVSARAYPRIPTAVGFCMFIRRALLDDIGPFDEARFGIGYGEENDFSFRALERGWLHVADDATFIHHAGHGSFGVERKEQQRRSTRALRAAHPRYMATIAAFMRADPLAPARDRILAALESDAPERPLKIVHLVHGWPPWQHGGTELYAAWLANEQRRKHRVAVYVRAADPSREEGEAVEWVDAGMRVRLVTNNFTARNPLRRNAIRDRGLERDFARFLREERPDIVHIHHLAGHAFSLAEVARRHGAPVVMQVQDWWFLCARVNQLDRDGRRCSGPAPSKCAACATLTKVPPSSVTNRILHALRRRAAARAFRSADVWICGSHAIANDYRGLVPRGASIRVIPYAVPIARTAAASDRATRPIRFGYVGAIGPHKGVHTAVAALRAFDASEAELRLWGDASAFPAFVRALPPAPNVHFNGTFAEGAKPEVFRSMDVLVVPSIGLESFGLSAREAMASGVPVIATTGGALSEMFAPDRCGAFFPPGDVGALRAIVRRIVDDPAVLDRWRTSLPRPKTVEEHAAEIDQVYDGLLRDGAR